MNAPEPFKHFFDFLNISGYFLERDSIKPDLPFVLSTVSFDCKPNSRIVFLKKIIGNEIIFFSNKNSQKGLEIDHNSNVSLCIFFPESLKQIRIEGMAYIDSSNLAAEYFETRPRYSKAGSILSKQSEKLENYQEFAESVRSLAESEKSLECPENWVAFRVIPSEFEFWEGPSFA